MTVLLRLNEINFFRGYWELNSPVKIANKPLNILAH